MKYMILSFVLLTGCAGRQLHNDVEVGNTAAVMMQCKILCDGTDKPYAFNDNGLNCQCQRPIERAPATETPILRFEIVAPQGSSENSVRGVMGQMSNGKSLMSVVPQGGN
jgi:hypothetical protein